MLWLNANIHSYAVFETLPVYRDSFSADKSQAMLHAEMRAGDESLGVFLHGGHLFPGRWGHIAFSIDRAGGARLTVDGAEVARGIFQGAMGVTDFC